MRIGFFVWEYPPALVGGLGTYAEYITREFVQLGHDVTVFTLNPGNLKTREILKGVEVHRPLIADASHVFPMFVTEDLRNWGTNIRFFNDVFVYNILSATKFINNLIRKEGYLFDVVCVHYWLSSIAGLIVKNETDISIIFPERYNPKNCKLEDVEALRKKYNIESDEKMILFVGRLAWVKSVKNLIQAMPMVLEEYPKAKLLILGKGEEQKDIVETANRLGIKDKVICRFEFIPEDERILHYAAADVCVFPSVYEPFGIVSLEAMAMEKPVVVGSRGVVGFREQVIPSILRQNGIHINGGDPADIAWGIKETLKGPNRAEIWGKNGRKRVLEYFTWRKAAEQTLEIYKAVMREK